MRHGCANSNDSQYHSGRNFTFGMQNAWNFVAILRHMAVIYGRRALAVQRTNSFIIRAKVLP